MVYTNKELMNYYTNNYKNRLFQMQRHGINSMYHA